MVYKYTGDFEFLKQLGFRTDVLQTYYFLPTHKADRFTNPLTISIESRIIEFTDYNQLDTIKDFIELID